MHAIATKFGVVTTLIRMLLPAKFHRYCVKVAP